MGSTEADPIDPADLTIVPASEATWADLTAIFGASDSGRCNCQRVKSRGWFWEEAHGEARRAQLRDQTNCGDPEATSTTGLVAYLTRGRVPVGWVAVEPRTEYPRLLGLPTVWEGRPGEGKQGARGWAARLFL